MLSKPINLIDTAKPGSPKIINPKAQTFIKSGLSSEMQSPMMKSKFV